LEVVGHQAVVVEPQGEALPVALDQVEEVGGILLGREHDLAIVPAIHHVVVDAHRLLLPARYAGMILVQPSSTVPSGAAASPGRPAASAA
jgi:hypothetical protein